MIKIAYVVLCIAGLVLPYSQFIPFLRDHGFDLAEFRSQLFGTRISGFFGLDVIVSSAVLWVLIYSEGVRVGMRRLWVYVVCNLLVGVSLALPLFLLMREIRLEHTTSPNSPDPALAATGEKSGGGPGA